MEIIAHRGASWDAPENTIASIQLAWEQGADAVEVDVRLSRDGQLVVIHDEHTGRTAGARKKVNEQTLAELKELDGGRWKAEAWVGERIPTLGEVLATLPPGKRLFLEIKAGSACVPEFQRLLQTCEAAPQQIVAIGFALDTMQQIKRALPEVEVAWIAEFKRRWKSGRWSPSPRTLIQKAKEAGLDGLDLGARGPISSRLVQEVKAARLNLYVWTVDSPAKARELIQAGVDGVTTNRPGWLRNKLRE